MSQQLNQFKQAPAKGDLDLAFNPNTFSAEVYASSGSTLYPGTAVKLVDVAGNKIIVDKAAATDAIIGFVKRSQRKSAFVAMDMIEVAGILSVMYGEAYAAIARGANVEYTASGDYVKSSAGSNTICGIAMDKATAQGDLVRFMVIGQLPITATITSGTINSVAIGGSSPAAGAFTTLSATGAVTGKTYGATKKTLTPGATVALSGADGDLQTLVPDQATTINATGLITGQRLTIKILTSGSSSFVVTFGTAFLSSGTLTTGVTTAKTFLVNFVCDGTNYIEVSRTAAL